MTVPYNTGKVKVGHAYMPPLRRRMSRDEERIQEMLIGSGVGGRTNFGAPSMRELAIYGATVVIVISTAAMLMGG